jgi:hypothetical protein
MKIGAQVEMEEEEEKKVEDIKIHRQQSIKSNWLDDLKRKKMEMK